MYTVQKQWQSCEVTVLKGTTSGRPTGQQEGEGGFDRYTAMLYTVTTDACTKACMVCPVHMYTCRYSWPLLLMAQLRGLIQMTQA